MSYRTDSDVDPQNFVRQMDLAGRPGTVGALGVPVAASKVTSPAGSQAKQGVGKITSILH